MTPRAIAGLLVVPVLACGGGAASSERPVAHADHAAATALPDGAQRVASSPAGMADERNFARTTSLALDENDDPAIAYVWIDPDGDGANDDTAVYFSAWDRAAGRFSTPASVAVIGTQTGSSAHIALAYDASAHAFGLAFTAPVTTRPGLVAGLRIAFSSDHGATWSTHDLDDGATSATAFAAITSLAMVMGNGHVHAAYTLASTGVRYASGAIADPPSTWTKTLPPALAGERTHDALCPSIALDASGQPALAYWSIGHTGPTPVFFRPGGAPSPIASISDSNAAGPIALGFVGTEVRVVMRWRAIASTTYPPLIYVSTTSTDGATWSAPLNIGDDGGAGGPTATAAAISTRGLAVVLYAANTGAGSGACGEPKLARTTDFAAWQTCSPDTSRTMHLAPSSTSVAVALGQGDAIYLAFANLTGTRENTLAPGLYVWRRP